MLSVVPQPMCLLLKSRAWVHLLQRMDCSCIGPGLATRSGTLLLMLRCGYCSPCAHLCLAADHYGTVAFLMVAALNNAFILGYPFLIMVCKQPNMQPWASMAAS
jgi:hypothetical protein